MQVLWSRAAQTRSSCRCSACLHAASAIARRTTTAASKRQLKIGDLFTACYSTILGTAVFADAKVKEERRKQWDRAIAEAKAEIPMDEPERVERTVTELDQAQELPSLVRPVSSHWGLVVRKISVSDGTSLTSSFSAQDDPMDITLNFHLKQALASPAESPQSLSSPSPEMETDWSDESDGDFSPREPLKQIHVDKMEEMISKLVTRLLLRSKDLSALGIRPFPQSDGSLQLKEIVERLESIQGSGTRLPSYTFHDPQVASKERQHLNNAIETLFGSTTTDQSNIDLILAKICYNLLVSSAPPNIQTYNTLIRCLTRLRLHELAQVVVDSFLFDSKFKPSCETIQLLLRHHSVQKDLPGFRAIVDRMRVVNADMHIKKRTLDTLYKPQVQEWATTKKVTHRGGILREKVTRDSDIFDSLINGFLELDKLRSAVLYLRAALREGTQVSSRTLLRIVQACTDALDYRAGLFVLRSLLKQWEGDSSSTIVYSGEGRLAVHQLFSLCAIYPSPYSTRPLPRNVSQVAVINLKRHIRIASIEDKIDRFAERIMSVEAVLYGTHAQDGFGRAQHALKIIHKGRKFEQIRSVHRKANNKDTAALQRAKPCDQKPWLKTQYLKLSEEWKTKYDLVVEQNPALSWSDRLEIISFYRERKNVPGKHHLYTTVLSKRQLKKRGLPRWQESQTDAETMKETVTAKKNLAEEDKSKLLPQSPSERLPQKFPSQATPRISSLPGPTPTLALLAPTNMGDRLYFTAG